MLLSGVLNSLASELHIEQITQAQYKRAVARFADYVGRAPAVSDLTIEQLNGYLLWLPSKYSIGVTSIRNYRTAMLRVWNFAHSPLGLTSACPSRRIRCPKRPEKPVSAWKLPAVEQLIKAAQEIPGELRRYPIPAHVFLTALVRTAYETGLRPSDLRELRWDQFDFASGTVILSQHKTGRLHTALIGPETIEALQALRKHHTQISVFPLTKTGVWKWEQKLYSRAAVYGFSKRPKQGIGTLRKTHATEVYRAYGLAAAAQSLGHYGDQSTARNHYIDSSTRKGYLPPAPRGDQTNGTREGGSDHPI